MALGPAAHADAGADRYAIDAVNRIWAATMHTDDPVREAAMLYVLNVERCNSPEAVREAIAARRPELVAMVPDDATIASHIAAMRKRGGRGNNVWTALAADLTRAGFGDWRNGPSKNATQTGAEKLRDAYRDWFAPMKRRRPKPGG